MTLKTILSVERSLIGDPHDPPGVRTGCGGLLSADADDATRGRNLWRKVTTGPVTGKCQVLLAKKRLCADHLTMLEFEHGQPVHVKLKEMYVVGSPIPGAAGIADRKQRTSRKANLITEFTTRHRFGRFAALDPAAGKAPGNPI